MNLKEELLKVTEYAYFSADENYQDPYITPENAEKVAESYAKEKAWEAWQHITYTWAMQRGAKWDENAERAEFEKWWEENK